MQTQQKNTMKKWLREASMRRLSQLVKNKTETIDFASKVQLNIDKLEDGLEDSGLNPFIVQQINDWVNGLLTGRQCMLAVLDSFQNEMNQKYQNFSFYSSGVKAKPQSKEKEATTDLSEEDQERKREQKEQEEQENLKKETEFQPINILRLSLQLPEQFFCDSGFLYEHLFQHPPLLLIKQLMNFILTQTNESQVMTLNLSQINIVLKQMKIDAFCGINYISHLFPKDNINEEVLQEEKGNSAPEASHSLENVLFISILIELLRIHILTSIQKKTLLVHLEQANIPANIIKDDNLYVFNHLSHSNSSPKKSLSSSIGGSEITYPFLEYYLNNPMKVIQDETIASLRKQQAQEQEQSKGDAYADFIESLYHTKSSVNSTKNKMPSLTSPFSPEDSDLETINNILKPYLKQLSTLKGTLAQQLKYVKESRAYMIFGLNNNASEDMVKKAYRNLAIKYHPDKPGGNTAKFQQLQQYYQEILTSIKQNQAEIQVKNVGIFQKVSKKKPNKNQQKSSVSQKETTKSSETLFQKRKNAFVTKEDDEEDEVEPDFEETAVPMREKPIKTDEKKSNHEESEENNKENTPRANVRSQSATTEQVKPAAKKSDPKKSSDRLSSSSSSESDAEKDDSDDSDSSSTASEKDHSVPKSRKDKETETEKEKEEDIDADDLDDEDIFESIDDIIARYTKNTNSIPEKPKLDDVEGDDILLDEDNSGDEKNDDDDEEDDADESFMKSGNSEKFQFPPMSTDYETHEEHAMIIYNYILSLLTYLQQFSHQFSLILQKNVKWEKTITKTFQNYTQNDPMTALVMGFHDFQKRFIIRHYMNLSTNSDGTKSKIYDNYEDYSQNIENSMQIIEFMCEISQKIVSIATELTSECGIEYATTLRNDPEFNTHVEKIMKLSIMTLQQIVPLVNHSQSMQSSYRRINESFGMTLDTKNIEIAEVLIQMIEVNITNNSKLFLNIMDYIMNLMNNIFQLKEIMSYLLQKTKNEMLEKLKKGNLDKTNNFFANFFNTTDESDEKNDDDIIDSMDYCDEDKELLKNLKRQEREEQKKRRDNPQNDNENDDDENNAKEKKENDKNENNLLHEIFGNPNKEGEEKNEETELLSNLKNKIKLLQYQLKCQQVNALKTLNSDLLTIQSQLIEEFSSIPLYNNLIELLNDKMKSFRHSTHQLKELPSSSSSSSSSSSALMNQNIKDCIFSFIAECIDNSLFLFRNAIMSSTHALPSFSSTSSSSSSSSSSMNYPLEESIQRKLFINEKICYYFSWMFITLLNNENIYDLIYQTIQKNHPHLLIKFYIQESPYFLEKDIQVDNVHNNTNNEKKKDDGDDNDNDNNHSTNTNQNNNSNSNNSNKKLPKLALFPDYRSKLFYFGSFIDVTNIYSMIQQEFPVKLNEIIEEWEEDRSSTMNLNMNNNHHLDNDDLFFKPTYRKK